MPANLKAKIAAIVARRLPKGYKLVEHKDPHGGGKIVSTKRGEVVHCPPLEDRYALGVFLHEIAHDVLGHRNPKDRTPVYQQEYEAEKWAMSAMQAEGMAVPVEMKAQAKLNVRQHIETAQAKDPELEIDDEILRFAFPDTFKEAA